MKLSLTKDGSHTVYSEQFGQFYHNPNGAIEESRHVFFKNSDILQGLKNGNEVRVLEIGFGTGLNALLLAEYASGLKSHSKIVFQSVEAWPLSPEIAQNLNYGDYLQKEVPSGRIPEIFWILQTGSVDLLLSPDFRLLVHLGLFETMSPEVRGFQYVFHDAFSPGVNAELWTVETFAKIRSFCAENAVLTTYSSATKARNAMTEAGWTVHKAPGALGKREMSIAVNKP